MTSSLRSRHTAKSILFMMAISLATNTLATVSAEAQSITAKQIGQVENQNNITNNNGQRKLILCLGGGGTRGAAHVGVLRELDRQHIKIDGIVGTSIGAIIGGLYCAGLTPDQIEHLLMDKSLIHSYLTVPIVFRLAVTPLMYIPHAFGHHPYDGLYHGNKFAKYVDKQVALANGSDPKAKINVEDLPIKFQAVCSDLLSAEPVAIARGDLGRALQASSAIPFLRRPVMMTRADFQRLPGHPSDDSSDSYMLVDGGPVANLPILQGKALADHLGGATVIAIDVYGDFKKFPPEHFRKIASSAERSLEMILSSVEKRDLNKADMVINPDCPGIDLLSMDTADAKLAIDAGEAATRKAMPELKRKLEMPEERVGKIP